MKAGSENKLCPSSTCHSGALLLGVVNGDQKVSLLTTPIPVNDEFVETVNAAGDPEKRFRFASKCAKNGCAQWTGSSCGIMDELAAANHLLEVINEQLPNCAIRPTCRWYSQDGAMACMICPYVVTQSEKPVPDNIEAQP
jgi:hypothetical protein